MSSPRLPAWLLGAILSLLTVVALAAPASAHASLGSTTPSDGEVVAASPPELRLEFNENVTAPPGGIRLFDSNGERVETGETATAPDTVIVALPNELQQGTYIATWRVTSGDGHTIAGAFVFSVGAEGRVDQALVAQLFSNDADRPFTIAAAVGRWLMYAGTLLAAGGAAFLLWMRREIDPTRRLTRPIWVGAAVAAVGTVAGVGLQGALVTGDGVGALVDTSALGGTLASWVGISSVVRLVGLGLLAGAAFALRGNHSGVLGITGGVLAIGSLLLEGHTLTTGPAWVVIPADAAHAAGAATWFGGLVLLILAIRGRSLEDDPIGAGRLIARFSTLATIAVITVTIAGLAMSWVEVRALRALFSTAYGWSLVVKLGIVLPILAAGAYNNRRLVPALARRLPARTTAEGHAVPAGGSGEAGVASETASAWRLLRRLITIEASGIVAVLAATAVLVSLQPAAEAAGIGGAYSTYVPFGDAYSMNLVVDPNRAGFNEIHVYVLGPTGQPADVGQEATMSMTLPTQDIGPIERTPQVAGPGHWLVSGPELSVPGTWELTFALPVSRFEQLQATVPVVVNP